MSSTVRSASSSGPVWVTDREPFFQTADGSRVFEWAVPLADITLGDIVVDDVRSLDDRQWSLAS